MQFTFLSHTKKWHSE